jgi:thymidylate synthase ThyX
MTTSVPSSASERATVTESARRIYLMKDLPPEVVAVAFAKTSRSPEPFDKIAEELTESASAQFHEKWVVGYGHASVAEHAMLSIAVENVSIIAAKAIEDNRLASYTEKSTRYQIYDPERVYRPASFRVHPELNRRYEELITGLLSTYIEWSERAIDHLKAQFPLEAGKSERMWHARLRARACDAIRYLLPTATLTNLGWTINARALAGAIRKLTGSPLPELRQIGEEVKAVAYEKVPTLLKYAEPDMARAAGIKDVQDSLNGTPHAQSRIVSDIPPDVRVLRYERDALQVLAVSVAYQGQMGDWARAEQVVAAMSEGEKRELIGRVLVPLGPFDPLPRAFEHINYLIEITVDYGAWRDIQRHRIGTQLPQELTPDLGYTVPALIEEMGLRAEFEQWIGRSAAAYDAIHAELPDEAVYALLLAFRKRSLFHWNLREVFHFVKLRGTSKGHDAYRAVAHDLWRKVLEVHPWLGGLLYPLGEDARP